MPIVVAHASQMCRRGRGRGSQVSLVGLLPGVVLGHILRTFIKVLLWASCDPSNVCLNLVSNTELGGEE